MLFPTFFQIINLLNFASAVHSQSTCGPKVSARLLMDIPCDMSQTNFCEMSGIAYPWAAVRRYIFENQGLLRRMYGDQRHYQILTNEIHDLKDRYDNVLMQDNGRLSTPKKKPQFRPRSIFLEDYTDSLDGEEGEQDKSSPNSGNASVNKTSSSARSEKPNLNQSGDMSYDHALPLDESTTTNHWLPTENDMATESTITEKEEESTVNPTTAKLNDETSPQVIRNSNKNQNDNEESSKSSSTPPSINVTQTQSTSSVILPKNDMPINESSSETSVSSSPNRVSSSFSTQDEPTSDGNTTSQPKGITSPIMTPQMTQTATTSLPTGSTEKTSSSTIKEEVIVGELPKKGVNACPVREEVIAPYWANNTRGEVLALLNVYPFEQYVHWEKCAYEKMQMFCREGCRCEQQYRLHRLLAFDPKNECRGIFADWFRFPSCCVCICYDLPESSILHRVGSHRKGRL